jgi:two-component system, sensor histidine kinase and response regulator
MKSNTDSDQVFDTEGVLTTVGGDMELLGEMKAIFLEDAPLQLARIEDGMSRNDAPAVRLSAHSLKGSAASLHAPRLKAAAFALETMGRDGDRANMEEGLRRVRVELDRFINALVAWMDRISAPEAR